MSGHNNYPMLEPYPGWMDEAVDTREASRITGVPAPTLITMRSRGFGPNFIQPQGTRLIRYFRRSLYAWMLSGGLKRSTSDYAGESALTQAENDVTET